MGRHPNCLRIGKMRAKVDNSIIEVVIGDITDEDSDVIVNAANKSLQVGGGVDGAILEVGGREILEECRELGGCDIGDAKITGAGNLNAQYVVHAVGPIYLGGTYGEAELLASAYRRSLELVIENGARSVSFPSISTGAHCYPVDEAARIAVYTVAEFLRTHNGIDYVRFVLYDQANYDTYAQLVDSL